MLQLDTVEVTHISKVSIDSGMIDLVTTVFQKNTALPAKVKCLWRIFHELNMFTLEDEAVNEGERRELLIKV